MTDQVGRLFVVYKHKRLHKKKARRCFYEADEIGHAIMEAYRLAQKKGEDFLVVKVITEAKSKGDEK